MKIEKLKGEFLRIVPEDENRYRVEYEREPGDPGWTIMRGDYMKENSEGAVERIEKLTKELSELGSQDVVKRRTTEGQLEYYKLTYYWPQIYVAWLKGEDAGGFFEIHRRRRTEMKYPNKHTEVKDRVDKLLVALRMERPVTTLEEAKRVYANFTTDTYANVNKAYHYKSKKS